MSGQRAVGHLEVAEQTDDLCLLTGWVRLPADGPPPVLLLHLDGAEEPALRHPLRLLVPRADLPALEGGVAGRGFQLVLRGLPAFATVTVALDLMGEVLPIGPGPVQPGPFRPRGHLGAANRFGVAGWLLDLPSQAPRLVVAGRHALPLRLDQHRPDLPFDDGTEAPLFGFRLTLGEVADALRAADPGLALMDGQPRDVVLMSGPREIGHAVLQVTRSMDGALEFAAPGALRGWAAEANPGHDAPLVDVLLDGTRWATLPARSPREDLLGAGIGTRTPGGSFSAELPTRNPAGAAPLPVALSPAHGAGALRGATLLEGLPPWRPDRGALLDTLPAALPPVAIIIPIHNATDDLARCIDSVLAHSTGEARLILIDDASTDPAMAPLLARHAGRPGIAVHANPRNLGFTATVNLGVALAGTDDVVLLNSDTIVGPGWLDGLRLAAAASPRIGTVTAISNNAGAFSAPEFDAANGMPEWFTPADLARLARQSALALWPEVPTGNGFCLYIRRACLDAVGPFDAEAFPRGYGEENDFCMRAGRIGFTHVVDDRTLVWHRRSASFGETRHGPMASGRAVLAARYPEYGTLVRQFREDSAFLALRWRLRRAMQQVRASGTTPRPRVLFVLSSRSGGTPQTNRDLMEALSDRYEAWTLHSTGRELELARHGEATPVESVRLERAIEPGTHRSSEYDRRVADMLLRHGFELVHIRHIAWHGLGLPEVCRALGIPVVFSFHDFYAVCPTIKLLDGEGRYCGGTCTRGEGACMPELWDPAGMPPLRDAFVHRWRDMLTDSLLACDAFVTTSPGARALLLDQMPALAGLGIQVIPHGRSFASLETLASEPMLEDPLRVLVPGNISSAKGGALVAAMAALDTERDVEFHVLGAVDGTLREARPGVVLHGRYDRDDFAAHVRAIRPHLGVVLSIWPETWCHTLTECWSVGLPVLGTDLGAVAERIRDSGAGWLVPHDAEPGEILALLQALKRDLKGLRARRDAALEWQRRAGRHHDSAAMAASYDRLYRRLLEARRSFAAAAPAAAPRVVLALPSRPEVVARGLGLRSLPRNHAQSPLLLRPAVASYPFGDPAAGPADGVLLGAGAVRARDLPGVLARIAEAGLDLTLEVDDALATALADGTDAAAALRDAVEAAGAALVAAGPRAALMLEASGLEVESAPLLLDPAAWLVPVPPTPALPDGPMPVLALADDPGLVALRPGLDHLAALEVARLRVAAPGSDIAGIAGFRGFAEPGALLVLCSTTADFGPQADRVLAAAAAGAVVLRAAEPGESPNAPPPGTVLLPACPDADAESWLRAIAELSVDPQRRAALTRSARQAGLAALGPPAPSGKPQGLSGR